MHAAKYALRSLTRRISELTDEINELEGKIADLIDSSVPRRFTTPCKLTSRNSLWPLTSIGTSRGGAPERVGARGGMLRLCFDRLRVGVS